MDESEFTPSVLEPVRTTPASTPKRKLSGPQIAAIVFLSSLSVVAVVLVLAFTGTFNQPAAPRPVTTVVSRQGKKENIH